MLRNNNLSGFGAATTNFGYRSMFSLIKSLGLETSFEICLDAGDSDSYSSGQKWLDLTANGYDFFRGTDGTSQTSDPTFNGTPGALSSSEYWSFDGGDRFRLDQANPTFVDNMHKDNAAWTIAGWWYTKAQAASNSNVLVASTPAATVGNEGFIFFLQPSGGILPGALQTNVVLTGGVDSRSTATEMLAAPDDQWNFLAVAVDEADPEMRWQINGDAAVDTTFAGFTSPDTDAAQDSLTIGATTDGTGPLDSGTRLAMLGIWSRDLSAAEMDALYEATLDRFEV